MKKQRPMIVLIPLLTLVTSLIMECEIPNDSDLVKNLSIRDDAGFFLPKKTRPHARFVLEDSVFEIYDMVRITNTSTNAERYVVDFDARAEDCARLGPAGNGPPGENCGIFKIDKDSGNPLLQHYYTSPGSYFIKLTAIKGGRSSEYLKRIEVRACDKAHTLLIDSVNVHRTPNCGRDWQFKFIGYNGEISEYFTDPEEHNNTSMCCFFISRCANIPIAIDLNVGKAFKGRPIIFKLNASEYAVTDYLIASKKGYDIFNCKHADGEGEWNYTIYWHMAD